MSNRVTLNVENQIATVTLNRPEKRNALDLEMLEAIAAIGDSLMDRRDVRCVVLTGEGPAFCAGLDVAAMPVIAQMVKSSGGLMPRKHGISNLFQHVAMVWRQLPMPVIAAVNGFAYGGGFQIILGADIRIVSQDCTFSVMEMKWGLVPDMGGIALMPLLAREDIIRRLTYTAEVFDPEKAQQWGFVTEICDAPLAQAYVLAKDIAGRSPDAIRAAKGLISNAAGQSVADILLAESQVQEPLIASPNQMEAVMAALQKRDPQFKD